MSGFKERMTPRFLVWCMVVPSAATINAARVHVYWIRYEFCFGPLEFKVSVDYPHEEFLQTDI